MKNKGITKKQLEDIISGKRSVDKMKIPEKAKKDLQQALADVRSYRERQKIPVNFTLKLKNADRGTYKYEKYLIDSEHSNSYRLRDKIQKTVSSKRSSIKEINESQGLRLEKVDEGVKKDLKSFDIELQPYSVVFLVLTPK
jgi:predicted ATP-dependent protease